MTDWLARNGFDQARLRFAFRTALACWIVVDPGWAMGLEHPHWSGMSVWAASQPLRGQLPEKSFFRFAGTVSGTIAGLVLAFAKRVLPAIMVAGLALWVGACTWIGNLQRGFIAYGTVLAGYSAAMRPLLDTARPDKVLHLGADRLATVLTGVVIGTVAGYFSPGAAAMPTCAAGSCACGPGFCATSAIRPRKPRRRDASFRSLPPSRTGLIRMFPACSGRGAR